MPNYNDNYYFYSAKPVKNHNEISFEGHGTETLLRHIRRIIKLELNDRCIAGAIKKDTEYEISVKWKEKTFVYIMTARPLKLGEISAD